MILAHPGVLLTPPQDRLATNELISSQAVFASLPRRTGDIEFTRATAPASSSRIGDAGSLLDYADFVLDQEAEYCQQ